MVVPLIRSGNHLMVGVDRTMASLRRSRILGGLVALTLAAAALGAASSASAESGSAPGKADKAAPGERHCTVDVKSGATQCFGTFREAIKHATGGRVTDAGLSAQSATADSKTTAKLNNGKAAAAAVVIGIQYYWENYNRNPDGSLHLPAYTLTHSGDVACTSSTSNLDYRSAPLLNDAGVTVNWNNNIRSFQAFNNCYERLWDNANCTGQLLNYAPSSTDLGVARDRTECIDWS
jgi:hypothetical protein